MTPILIATQNPGKLREFESLLSSNVKPIAPDERAPQVEEDGVTYSENALKKAKAFYDVYRMPVLSDDSGLEIDVLNGAPGIWSARFGGENISWSERFQKLFQVLAPFPEAQWSARFRCVLCLILPNQEPLYFEGLCEGKIEHTPKGNAGFGYDPIFFSNALKKSLGEANPAEKAQVSHRAQAVKAFLDWAKKNPHKLS